MTRRKRRSPLLADQRIRHPPELAQLGAAHAAAARRCPRAACPRRIAGIVFEPQHVQPRRAHMRPRQRLIVQTGHAERTAVADALCQNPHA